MSAIMRTAEPVATPGVVTLCSVLLDRCSLPPDVTRLARSLINVDGLRTLSVEPLGSSSAAGPLAFYRAMHGDATSSCAGCVQVVLLDLDGNGGDEVSLRFPSDALPGANSRCFLLRDGGHASSHDDGSGPAAIFSKVELMHGQLHLRVPPRGMCTLQLDPVPATESTSPEGAPAPTPPAHLLSSLYRLARRPAQHARHNAAAATLSYCARGEGSDAVLRWRELWASLQRVAPSDTLLLARRVSSALYTAARAGMLGDGEEEEEGAVDANRANGVSMEKKNMAPAVREHERRSVQPGAAAQTGCSARALQRVLDVFDRIVREVGDATDERVPSATCGTGPRCAGAGAHADGTGSSSSNTDDEAVAMLRAVVCAARHRQVVLVTPEIGEWCSVGGLGTMVDHFSSALASQSAFQDGHVSVIAPAYDCFSSRWASLPALLELSVPLGQRAARCRVRCVVQRRVHLYLLECPTWFATPYPAGDPATRLAPAVLLARASLLLLERIVTLRRQPPPDCIISNDWVRTPHRGIYLRTPGRGPLNPLFPPHPAPPPRRGPLNLLNLLFPPHPTPAIALAHTLTPPTPSHRGHSSSQVASLVAPYARHTAWAGTSSAPLQATLSRCLFVHLVHNLEAGYDGRMQTSAAWDGASNSSLLSALHQLPRHLLHERRSDIGAGDNGTGSHRSGLSLSHGSGELPARDEAETANRSEMGTGTRTMDGNVTGRSGEHLRHGGTHVGTAHYASHSSSASSSDGINLTRAAFLCADAWATVSKSYHDELLASSYAPLLKRLGSGGIACDSGLPLARRRAELKAHGGHPRAKTTLQRALFGEGGVQPSTPLFVFIGRIAYQKGVHLLLDCFPALFQACRGHVQLLVCGLADPSDAYARRCAEQMAQLRASYPNQFWAAPHVYFDQGPLASVGADFGVMPSLYEPSGLVREEFFAAGTPLVCSVAGALRDRVDTYDEARRTGTGVCYEVHTHSSLLSALQRAAVLYSQPADYSVLRANAHAAACDMADTAWHWSCEIQRLLASR